jgi:hypothetical protein
METSSYLAALGWPFSAANTSLAAMPFSPLNKRKLPYEISFHAIVLRQEFMLQSKPKIIFMAF